MILSVFAIGYKLLRSRKRLANVRLFCLQKGMIYGKETNVWSCTLQARCFLISAMQVSSGVGRSILPNSFWSLNFAQSSWPIFTSSLVIPWQVDYTVKRTWYQRGSRFPFCSVCRRLQVTMLLWRLLLQLWMFAWAHRYTAGATHRRAVSDNGWTAAGLLPLDLA